MQVLLVDRFRLKLHKDIREIPVYELTAAGGGLKLPATQQGSCIPLDDDHPGPVGPRPGQPIPSATRLCTVAACLIHVSEE